MIEETDDDREAMFRKCSARKDWVDERQLQGGSQATPDAEPLDDNDFMPFGEHKGVCMEEVPPNYLLYIVEQEWIDKWPRVKAYIIFNQETLEVSAS